MDQLKKEMKMMYAVSEALKYKKSNPMADNSEITKHILKVVQKEKNQEIKLLLIAASSKMLSLAERNPKLNEKELIKRFIQDGFPELPQIED